MTEANGPAPTAEHCKAGCLNGFRRGYVEHPFISDHMGWVKCSRCKGTGVEPEDANDPA